MKKTTLALLMTVFTASTLFSTVTCAEGPDQQQWHQKGGHDGRGGSGRAPEHGQHDRGNNQHAQHDRGNNYARNAGGHNRHYQERDRFAWQGHDFRRGRPLPPHFRGDSYRINDWHARGLRQPPRGEYWAYIDGNYVLIAAATGVITSILLNSVFH